MKPHLFSSIPLRVIILTGIMFFSTCQEPEKPEPYPDSNLVLEKLDVSCTEAWLKVSLTQTDSSAMTSIPVILTRDGEVIQSFAFTPPETLVVDAGLDPSHSYQYQVQRQSVYDNKIINSSNTLTVTTLDTTSHDFTWTIDTLGTYGSYLNDVAIIDDNNIWAVGMIETDSGSYNAAHWEGEEWGLVRIAPPPFLFAPLTSIYALSGTDVWVAGTAPMEFDGEIWNAKPTYPTSGWINAIWGSSPEDVWFVGSGGSIVHYDGSGFTRLESGTDIDLHQINGTADGEYIFFQGKHSQGYRTILLQLHQGVITKIYECETLNPGENDYGYLYSSYLSGYAVISVTKAGVWKYNYMTGQSVLIPNEITDSGDRYIRRIVGNNGCDFILAGNWWDFIHFNGQTYKYYDQLIKVFGEGGSAVYGAAMRGDLVVVDGYIDHISHAAVAFGRRE